MGEPQICNISLLESFLNHTEGPLAFEMVEIFFCLLRNSVKNCSAISASFSKKNLFPLHTRRFSSSRAAQLLPQYAKAILSSAEYIFLPFFDFETNYWNLIVLRSMRQQAADVLDTTIMPQFYFFNGAEPASTIKTQIVGENRRRLR